MRILPTPFTPDNQSKMLKLISSLLIALFMPALVHGQACFSNPAEDGGGTLELRQDAVREASSYGADFRANLAGTISTEIGYRLITSDTLHSNGNAFHAGLAGERSLGGLSICGAATPEYSSFTEPEVFLDSLGVVLDLQEQTDREFRLPLEVSVGRRRDFRGLTLIPSLGAAYVFSRRDVTSSKPLESSRRFLETRVAFAVAMRSVFGRIQLGTSTGPNSEPTLSLGFGFLLR